MGVTHATLSPCSDDALLALCRQQVDRCDDRWQERRAVLGAWVACSADLIHGLQRERGWSNRWLAAPIDPPRVVIDEMRAVVDHAWQRWTAALRVAAAAGQPDSPDVWRAASTVVEDAAQRASLRERIDARHIPWEQATAAWTSAISAVLVLLSELGWTLGESNDAPAMGAWLAWLQLKELCGQERAIGTALWSQRHLDEAHRQWLRAVVERQQQVEQVLRREAQGFAPDVTRAEEGEWQPVLLRMRRWLLTAPADHPLPPDWADAWFDICTQRIDAMHAAEAELRARVGWLTPVADSGEAPPAKAASWPPQPMVVDGLRRLRRQLADQVWIDRAKAVLLSWGMTEAQAYAALRREAMDGRLGLAQAARRWLGRVLARDGA